MKQLLLLMSLSFAGFCAISQPQMTLYFHNKTQASYSIRTIDSIVHVPTSPAQVKFFFNNQPVISYPISSIDSATFDAPIDYSSINAYFDRAYYCTHAFQDVVMKIPAAQNKAVLALPEMVEKKGKVMSYTTTSTSHFPVPGAVEGEVPLFSSEDGGYIHLFNGLNKTYVTPNESPDLKPVVELFYVVRKYPTITYEQFHGGYGWLIYKFDANGNAIIGVQNQNATYKNGKGMFDDLEVVLLHEVYYADSTRAEIFITDHRGDVVSQGISYDAPGGFIRQAAIGSGGHGMNQDFFGMWYTLGRTLTPQQRLDVTNKLKAIYPIGKKPDLPYCNPVLTWNSGTASFDLTLHYQPGAAANGISSDDIDLDRTVVRWYYGDQKGTSTGNMLDKQDTIRTTNGHILSLTRSSFPTYFPPPYPSTNYINVGVTVFNKRGQFWREIPASPLQDNR